MCTDTGEQADKREMDERGKKTSSSSDSHSPILKKEPNEKGELVFRGIHRLRRERERKTERHREA